MPLGFASSYLEDSISILRYNNLTGIKPLPRRALNRLAELYESSRESLRIR